MVALRDPDSSFSVRPPGVVRGMAREVGSLIRRGLGGCAVDLVAGGGFAVAGFARCPGNTLSCSDGKRLLVAPGLRPMARFAAFCNPQVRNYVILREQVSYFRKLDARSSLYGGVRDLS